MQINKNYDKKFNHNNFKGWDASKPLKAIIMSEPGLHCKIAKELSDIGDKIGFDVFVISDNKLANIKKFNIPYFAESISKPDFKRTLGLTQWIQDILSITPNNKIINEKDAISLSGEIATFFNQYKKSIIFPTNGGNMFFVKNGKNYNLLMGEEEKTKISRYIKKHKLSNLGFNIDSLANILGCKNVKFLPQMDYHLDLAIKPLDEGKILIADDNLTLKVLDSAIKRLNSKYNQQLSFIDKYNYEKILSHFKAIKNNFQKAISENGYFNDSLKLEKQLRQNGFEPIRVPARLYGVDFNGFLIHKFNYLNSIATKNKKGELVYIAGASTFDKQSGLTEKIEREIDFSFQRAFIESISKHVKAKNIFFVSGAQNEIQSKLSTLKGGLHCLSLEIPFL